MIPDYHSTLWICMTGWRQWLLCITITTQVCKSCNACPLLRHLVRISVGRVWVSGVLKYCPGCSNGSQDYIHSCGWRQRVEGLIFFPLLFLPPASFPFTCFFFPLRLIWLIINPKPKAISLLMRCAAITTCMCWKNQVILKKSIFFSHEGRMLRSLQVPDLNSVPK